MTTTPRRRAPTRRLGPILLGLACILTAAAAVAQPTRLELAGASAPAPLRYPVGVSAWAAEIRLANTDTTERRFRAGTILRRASDGASQTLTVQRLDAAPGDRLIPPNGEAVLRLSADLPTPGTFTASIDVLAISIAGGQQVERLDRQVSIEVTREIEAVPADLLVTPRSEALVWPWFWNEPRASVLTLRNVSTKPVEFDPPRVLGLTREDGPDRPSGLAMENPPTLASDGCVSPLRPGQSCSLLLTMTEKLMPGVYGVEVGLGGVGGGWSAKTLRISVRASLLLAFCAALAGVWAGVYVDEWRTRGRPLLDGLEATTRLRDQMSGPVPADLALTAADLRGRIDEAADAYQRGVGRAEDVDRLKKMVDRFAMARQLSDAFARLNPFGRRVIAPRYGSVRAALLETDPPEAAAARARDAAQTVAVDIAAWPGADAAADAAIRFADALGTLAAEVQPPLPSLADLAGDQSDLRAVAAAIRQPELGSDFAADALRDTVAQRRIRLDAAVARALGVAQEAAQRLGERCAAAVAAGGEKAPAMADLRRRAETWRIAAEDDPPARLRDLAGFWRAFNALGKSGAAEAPAGAQTAAPAPASPPMPGSVSQIAISFGVRYGQSLAELQAARARHQFLSNWIIAALAALASTIAISGNAAWGSPGDVMTIFIAGVGTRMVAGALTNRTVG